VRSAAESLGVSERSVWRWLTVGVYEPGWRVGWRTTEEAIEALYRTGGRPTAACVCFAMRECRCRRIPPSVARLNATCRRRSAYARHGEDGRRRYSVYRRWEPKARNEVWETDHNELDINVLPLRGRRLVRPWLTVIEEGFSRLVRLGGWKS
jgi:putative transposase